jgi:hypothetical protein
MMQFVIRSIFDGKDHTSSQTLVRWLSIHVRHMFDACQEMVQNNADASLMNSSSVIDAYSSQINLAFFGWARIVVIVGRR